MSWDTVRQLTDGQQIAVLFVLLFGALSIASLIVFSRSLHTSEGIVSDDSPPRGRSVRRELGAMWVGALIFWTAWASGPVGSTLLFGVLSFLALREFVTLTHTRRADHRALILVFFVILPVQYVVVANRHFDLFTVFVPVYVFLALPIVTALRNDPTRFLERAAKLQWGLMVCLYGMSHVPALLLLGLPGAEERGAFLAVYLVAVVAAAQLGQNAASRRLRRRPVARAISRNFSWRAWGIGAFCGGMIGLALFWATPFDPLAAWALGAITGGAGTFGDFVMQALKRDAGVRFWGSKTSITGAVGLLDRVAALCFAAPVFFHVTRWTFGLVPG